VAPDRLAMNIAMDPAAGNVKDLVFELPPGFVGDPNAVSTCPRQLLSVYASGECSTASQAGSALFAGDGFGLTLGIYNVEPDPGSLVELGFKSFALGGRLFIKMLPNGQAQFELHDLVQDAPLTTVNVAMWGIPADHQTAFAPRRAFLATPTRCDGAPPAMKLRVRSWQQPDVWHAMSVDMGGPLVGCDDLEIEPRLDFALESGTTDSSTGAQVQLTVPQEDDPDGKRTAGVKDVLINFPEGVAMSPSAANRLTACPEQAVGLGRLGPTSCPASSKIGTAELSSPLLPEVVEGVVHIGDQQSDTDYRMYVVMKGMGVDLKLAGTLHADPDTGQLSTQILDVPELPFDRLTLNISGGPNALLVTPLACGSGTASVTLTPYSGGPSVGSTAAVSTAADPFGRPCPARLPFDPVFVAGTSRTRAGAAGPFAVTIRRASGEQLLDRFSMTLPPGVSARLASVPRCTATAAAAGACPRGSRIGSAIAEAGSGASPFALEGDAFLTGPYRRAPFGMALVFDVVAGPFDLGTVVIRAALRIDPRTGQVTVQTDPLPRIVKGVPLRIQTIALDIDRPGFITNPTSCAPSEVAAVLESAAGDVSRSKSRFAVGGCRALRFRPKLSMALTDRSELHDDGHPGLRLRLRSSPRGANLRDLGFELPELLQPSVTGPTAICSLSQLEDERCPEAAKIGSASGRTPLLSKPLRGSVYLVQPPGNGIADVWAAIRSEGVNVRFRMKNVLEDGLLSGKLVDLPDIPLSSLTMTFASGEHGMFSATRAPCVRGHARRMLAKVRLTAHSAATRRAKVPVGVGPGC
jgi:hypothetical protein